MTATNKNVPARAFLGGPRMKRSISYALLLAFFSLTLAWSPAYAAKQVATVVAARGDIQALDVKGKSRALAPQAPIFEEDTIKTGPHSRAQIMFTDNTLINLGNETTMKIAEYRWQPEQKDGALKTQIKEGTFRVMGGALSKTAPQNFKTETPSATIGIRGSMYAGVVTPNFLSVVFQGGKGIEITNPFGTVEISKPGYGTKVALDKPPLPPMKFTAKEMGEMNKALSGNGNGEKEEKKEDKKEKGDEKGKKEDKGPEKAPAAKEGQSTAPAPAESQTTSTAPASETAPAPAPADTLTTNGWATTTIDPTMDTATPLATATLTTPPIVPLVPDLTTVAVDTSQNTIVTTVSGTAATTVVNSVALSGNHHFFLRNTDLTLTDPSQFNSTFLNYAAGPFTATLLDTGEIYGTLSNGKPFGPYIINGYDPNATYSGFSTIPQSVTYNDDTLGTLNLTATIYGEPSAQFFYSTFYDTIDSSTDYLIGSLLYAGIPYANITSGRLTIPATGIDKFLGHLMFNNLSASYPDADMEETAIAVNYYNHRLIGRSFETKAGVTTYDNDGAVFFGTLNNSTGTASITVLAGGDPGPYGSGDVTTAYGSASATLYGSSYQGIGFTASGADYSIIDNTQNSTWQATGAAMRAATPGTSPSTAPTYNGFVVGVADDTSSGKVSRIFMNSLANDFTMAADPLTGVVTGSIIANELLGGTALNLTIGGNASNSAYVDNNDLVALFSSSSSHTLRTYGNYLVTAGPAAQQITQDFTDGITWGYWEVAYTDPADASNDHLFSSQSFFVTGQLTDPAEVDNLIVSNFTGTYNGKAYGVKIDGPTASDQDAIRLTSGSGANPYGSVNLTIKFGTAAPAPAVSGSFNFDQATLNISSAASTVNNAGFATIISDVSGVSPSTSVVKGAFYGTDAAAVGGNFDAKMGTTGPRYLGVFGANR
jgi:hypothetical protein